MFSESAEKMNDKGTLGLVILGPLFGLVYVCFLPLIALLTLLLALPEFATAKKPDILENGGACMGCHESRDLTKTFGNGEKLALFVSAKDFNGTVHSFLNCTDCHQKVSLDSHPGATAYPSRSAFVLSAVTACRTCHSDAQLQTKPNHAFLMNNKTHAPPCTECHGSHSIKRISEWKPTLAGNQYCLTCHRQKISMTMRNGEKLSLYIDPSLLASSVHNKHACSDCHSDYTRESHPVRTFESNRKHSIAVSQVCSRCHADKSTAIKGNIHYNLSFEVGDTLISQGNPKAPVCTDCHGFHKVGPKETYDTLSGVPCRKCHEQIFKLYSKSVHGLARANGEHKAPLCFSCHFAHEVKPVAMAERIKTACLGCHKEVETAHRKWLPNADLHLSMVSCASCHSPGSKKGIYLRLVDDNTGKPFTEDQMAELLGTGYEDVKRMLSAHGEGIDSAELWSIVQRLNEKGTNAKITFYGRMDVSDGSDAHRLSFKKNAVKDCEQCHAAGSGSFRDVTVAIVRADGKLATYKAKPEVLGSVVSLLSLRQFYVLGGTRLKALDWIGLVMVFGGMLVPIGHITARVLTAPLRERRKNMKAGKEDRR
jgi:hypothetical protein